MGGRRQILGKAVWGKHHSDERKSGSARGKLAVGDWLLRLLLCLVLLPSVLLTATKNTSGSAAFVRLLNPMRRWRGKATQQSPLDFDPLSSRLRTQSLHKYMADRQPLPAAPTTTRLALISRILFSPALRRGLRDQLPHDNGPTIRQCAMAVAARPSCSRCLTWIWLFRGLVGKARPRRYQGHAGPYQTRGTEKYRQLRGQMRSAANRATVWWRREQGCGCPGRSPWTIALDGR